MCMLLILMMISSLYALHRSFQSEIALRNALRIFVLKHSDYAEGCCLCRIMIQVNRSCGESLMSTAQ